MRFSNMLGRTTKETPNDAELPSHQLLIRAGLIRRYSSGVYGLLPLAKRSIQKIEAIVREEMNRVNGQEVTLPCLGSQELWSESGRYQAIGADMFRLSDRNEQKMLLCMTHEEPAVHMVRQEVNSYKQLPLMIYQIQSKFRDEKRPRGGLIRLREFIMKDGYSFHTSEEDLKTYYNQVHKAYRRVFKRLGFRNFIDVQSDNGIFGGQYSHEFMSITASGEDTLFICSQCDYKANREVAKASVTQHSGVATAMDVVDTPGIKKIEDLSQFLKVDAKQIVKTVIFESTEKEPKPVVCLIRGDLDVLQLKAEVALKCTLVPASKKTIEDIGGVEGFTGPIGVNLRRAVVVIDKSVEQASGCVTGANQVDKHYRNFDMNRDFMAKLSKEERATVQCLDIRTAKEGDPCPSCQAPLNLVRGIEIGNIFHLGKKYSESMKMTYLDENGKAQVPTMGCYGIGITRALPALIEDNFDENGIIFPMTTAPYHVYVCVLNYNKVEIKTAADQLYDAMVAANLEVLLDDRNMAAGFQFRDADLLGMPIRVVLSPKTLEKNVVEIHFRDKRAPSKEVAIADVVKELKNVIAADLAKINDVADLS